MPLNNLTEGMTIL